MNSLREKCVSQHDKVSLEADLEKGQMKVVASTSSLAS
jgi:hypothetical protein